MSLAKYMMIGSRFTPTPTPEEKADLQATYPATWQDKLDARYKSATLTPISFAAYAALFANEGDIFRDPTFGTKIMVAEDSINQVNSERPHQNCDNTRWFFRFGTNFQLYDNTGAKVGGRLNLNFESVNPQDAVRWHPTNPHILFYIKDDHIIYYDIRDNSKTAVATSPNGNLGNGSSRRLAGGDGNIAVKVGTEAWILLSHVSTNTNCQVLVLADPDNAQANDWKIVSHNWTGSAWELQYETWDVSATKFTLPAGTLFDYATLTLVDPTDGWPYISVSADGNGTDYYNLSGTKIGDEDSNSNHKNEVYFTTGGTSYPAMVKKAVNGTIPPDVNIGDAAIRYREVDLSADPMTMTTTTVSPPGLDWGSGYNQAGGGQYSSYSTRNTCLLSMNSAVEEGATDWQKYYSEIVEIQLNADASDDVPRRLLHHMIDTFGSVSGQPEAWLSNDGTHGFFKSNVGGQLSGDGYLFWFEILERTPVGDR